MNDWVCGNCRSINRASANSCYSCGGSRDTVAQPDPRLAAPTVATADALGGATLGVAGVAPAAALGAPLATSELAAEVAAAAPAPARPASTSDVLGGLVAGLLGAVLATAIWYGVVVTTHFQVGIVAIAVGFIVGQAVAFGARGRGSIALVPISVVLTLLALVASEYLIVAHFVGQELGVPIEVVQPPDFVLSVVGDSLGADPLTLVFWAIALFQAFVIPWRSTKAG